MPNPRGINQYSKGRRGSSKKSKNRRTQTDKGGSISRTEAAARMFGTGSKQHKAALKRFR